MTLKLYNFFRNSAGHRVRIALHLKGLDFEYVSIDIRAGRQQDASYKAVNPLSLIPALDHDGRIVTQSTAIIEYLEELYPAPSLLPVDPFLRAKSRAVAASIAAEMHAMNNMRVHKFLGEELKLDGAARNTWFQHWNRIGFGAIEADLAASSNTDFAFADYPTIADIFLAPQYYNLRRVKFDLAPYPRIGEIVARCEAHPAFQKAAPEAQPDYVEGE
ncbi:MAG: maleylacetoacetate isomerase [Parvibaculum sp.]|uniref:maleylacetoacetate isomerase n=1 Tax=Parvibaculum sp. TaxID=2024848 RepID=UPI003C763240